MVLFYQQSETCRSRKIAEVLILRQPPSEDKRRKVCGYSWGWEFTAGMKRNQNNKKFMGTVVGGGKQTNKKLSVKAERVLPSPLWAEPPPLRWDPPSRLGPLPHLSALLGSCPTRTRLHKAVSSWPYSA